MEGTNMPGFEKTLNDAQIKAVVSHVRSLGRQ
jgi:mono/diheme cytochrome c family protein